MFRRNVAGQFIPILVLDKSGDPVTSGVTFEVVKDNGAAAPAAGPSSHKTGGVWIYEPTAGEMDASLVTIVATKSGIQPAMLSVRPVQVNPDDGQTFGLTSNRPRPALPRLVPPGKTSVSAIVFVPRADGLGGLTGLTAALPGVTCTWYRQGTALAGSLTLIALATPDAAWASGGFIEIDATNLPGYYRLDLPDEMFASGSTESVAVLSGPGMTSVTTEFVIGYQPSNVVQVNSQPAQTTGEPVAANLVQFNGLAIPAGIPANITQVGGTNLTGNTVPASISGVVSANVTQVGGTAIGTGALPATLVPTGLDAIPVSDPGGVDQMTTLPSMAVAVWRRFYKKTTIDPTGLRMYADDGQTVNTTQSVSNDEKNLLQIVEAAR